MPSTELGEFLIARRAATPPAPDTPQGMRPRRVPGLRRDEVAAQAGVSVDYYRRLEQGREKHPSRPVLAALARTFGLTLDEEQHLYSLAGVAWRLGPDDVRRPVDPALLELMASWRESGAFVLDPVLDILAMNARAVELFAPFSDTTNLVEMVMLDPVGRTFFVDWETAARSSVANLRASADFAATPRRFEELVRRLTRGSPAFAELWARHEVRVKTYATKDLMHPALGPLTVGFHAFQVPSAPGHQLVVYQELPATHAGGQLDDQPTERTARS
ncbi:helix-turn-helix domain-containing protein [Modestobacter sp. SYSU DS0657]